MLGGEEDVRQRGGAQGVNTVPHTSTIEGHGCLGGGSCHLAGHVHPGAVDNGVAIKNKVLWGGEEHLILQVRHATLAGVSAGPAGVGGGAAVGVSGADGAGCTAAITAGDDGGRAGRGGLAIAVCLSQGGGGAGGTTDTGLCGGGLFWGRGVGVWPVWGGFTQDHCRGGPV